MSATNSTLYVDRDEASKILKVSTRTVDRYLRKHKFKTRKSGRTVLIKRTDVDKIIQNHIGHFLDDNKAKLDESLKQEAPVASNIAVKDIKVEKIKEPKEEKVVEKNEKGNVVYKELYLETKKELKEKQERLEAATYRVGQLEAQVQNMVPQLDFTRKEKEMEDMKASLEGRIAQSDYKAASAEKRVAKERMAKFIYLSLVGLLLIAEPILFLLWAMG